MRPRESFWYGLLVLLVASGAWAGGYPRRAVQTVLLSEHPDRATHRVYVKGQVVTTLRFEQPVDAGRTKMIGWEGRLEPLAVVRNKVILEPMHDLDTDEAIALAVVLVDGTEVAFLLRPPPEHGGEAEQQINVFQDLEAHGAMHAILMRTLEEKDALSEENARYHKEERSEDHALAALLVSGAVAQTPFTIDSYVRAKDADTDLRVS